MKDQARKEEGKEGKKKLHRDTAPANFEMTPSPSELPRVGNHTLADKRWKQGAAALERTRREQCVNTNSVIVVVTL